MEFKGDVCSKKELDEYFGRFEDVRKVEEDWFDRKFKGRVIRKRDDALMMFKDYDCIHTIRVVDKILEDLYEIELLDTDNFYFLSTEKFARHFRIDTKEAYRILKDVAEKFFETIYKTREGSTIYIARLIEVLAIDEEKQEIKLKFTRTGADCFTNKQEPGTFTSISAKTSLTSSSGRYNLMSFIQKYSWKGKFTLTVKELREAIGLTDKYKNWAHFEQYVLIPSLADLKTHVGIVVEYSLTKKGKAVNSITFSKVKL